MLGDDDALTFEFVIGTLNGDDAYLKVDGKLADRRDRLTFRPVTNRNRCLICSMIWKYMGRLSDCESVKVPYICV